VQALRNPLLVAQGFRRAEPPSSSLPAGEELGVERIGEVLRGSCGRPAAEILGEDWAELARFKQGAPAADDPTATLLKRST
jgi:hypothetical protein